MDKTKALELWEKRYGNRDVVYDYAAQKMVKDDFENETSGYSWTVDMIKPTSFGGRYSEDNLILCTSLTKKVRGEKLTFRIGNVFFEVRKGKNYGTSALYDVTDRNHPLDVSTLTEEMLSEEYHLKRQKEIYGRENRSSFVLPNLSAIRKNVVAENAPEIAVEYEEKTPALVKEECVSEKKKDPEEKEEEKPVLVELPEEEEETVPFDERDILFFSLEKEEKDASSLRNGYLLLLKEKATLLQTKNTLLSSYLALKDALILSYQNQEVLQKRLKEKDQALSEAQVNKEVLDSLSAETASLKTELGKQYNDYALLQARYEECNRKLAEKETEITALNTEKEKLLNSLSQTSDDQQKEINLYKGESEKQKTEIDDLHHLLSEKENQLSQIQQKKEELETKIQNTEALLQQSENKEKESSLIYEGKLQEIERLQTSLEEQKQETEHLKSEKEDLEKRLEEKEKATSEDSEKAENEKKELLAKMEHLQEENQTLSASQIAYHAEKESILAEKESLYNKTVELNVVLNDLKNENGKLTEEKEALRKEKENEEENYKETSALLIKQKEEAEGKIIFLSAGGDEEHYSDYLFYLSDNDKTNNKENVEEALTLYPTWHRKDEQRVSDIKEGEGNTEGKVVCLETSDVSYLEKEKENREKAFSYWAMKYQDIEQTTDFAGRTISLNAYQDKQSGQGWNYLKYSSEDREYEGNILIANLRTILDFKEKESFKSNGQTFHVVEENGVYHIESENYVTDPYDLGRTLLVTKENLNKKSPLLYLFVKCVGKNNNEPEKEKVLEFFDLIDRTVKRTCPKSFIEMKAGGAKADYVFLTFDGNVEGSYKEVLDYALLLNSYRNELRKEENGVNAFVVLDQVMVPYSYRHFSFEQILSLTKDLEMRAISYEFLQTSIVNSLIKKTIHIGPSILDELPLDQSSLKESYIGQTKSFSEIYNFRSRFYVYNFIYSLKKEKDEEK